MNRRAFLRSLSSAPVMCLTAIPALSAVAAMLEEAEFRGACQWEIEKGRVCMAALDDNDLDLYFRLHEQIPSKMHVIDGWMRRRGLIA
jgi:hypothetical protein